MSIRPSRSCEHRCGQIVKGLEVSSEPLVAELEPSEMAEAGERAFDNVAELAQPAAVRGAGASGHEALDPARLDHRDLSLGAVGAIREDGIGLATRASAWLTDRRQRIQQSLKLLLVGRVRGRRLHHQRHALDIGQNVSLAAAFASIHGIGTGVRAPFKARTDAESTTTCE